MKIEFKLRSEAHSHAPHINFLGARELRESLPGNQPKRCEQTCEWDYETLEAPRFGQLATYTEEMKSDL